MRLGRAQADLLATAARGGARPILVTDGLSVVTEAFRQALLDCGGAWVVRGDDGLRNGLDGGRLDDFTDALRTGPPTSVQDVAVGYLRPWTPTAEHIVVSVSVRHRAADETVLGATTELLATELAGAAPTGWGTHEPRVTRGTGTRSPRPLARGCPTPRGSSPSVRPTRPSR